LNKGGRGAKWSRRKRPPLHSTFYHGGLFPFKNGETYRFLLRMKDPFYITRTSFLQLSPVYLFAFLGLQEVLPPPFFKIFCSCRIWFGICKGKWRGVKVPLSYDSDTPYIIEGAYSLALFFSFLLFSYLPLVPIVPLSLLDLPFVRIAHCRLCFSFFSCPSAVLSVSLLSPPLPTLFLAVSPLYRAPFLNIFP